MQTRVVTLDRFLLENVNIAKGEKNELIFVWQNGRLRPLRYTIRIR
jgi:hypothetical protein